MPATATRKQVTVLFCDVVGYTARSLALDPEDLADEIRVFQQLCADAAGRHHGHIANFLGDGLLVLFGHPRASEFDAERAVRAGIEMVERIERNNESLRWRGRTPMHIRIGIATGLVVVGERAGRARDRDELIFGAAPNLAARLQNLAAPNTAVAALRTRRLAGDVFRFRNLGIHPVKGFARPIKAWRIVRERAAMSIAARTAISIHRATIPFIGRQCELRRLRRHFDRARAGSGRAVLIRGERGIGKSRLVRVFEKRARTADVCHLRITCSPHYNDHDYMHEYEHDQNNEHNQNSDYDSHSAYDQDSVHNQNNAHDQDNEIDQNSMHDQHSVHEYEHDSDNAFAPIIAAVHRYLRISDDDDVAHKRESLRRAMASLALVDSAEHRCFAALFGIASPMASSLSTLSTSSMTNLDNAQTRERIAAAVATVVVRLSRRAPLLVVVEDLHWADASTLATLARVVAHAERERLLAVFTARADFASPWQAAQASELNLGALNTDESAQLIAAASGAHQPSAKVVRALVRRCGGVPLYLRETSLHRLALHDDDDDAMSHGVGDMDNDASDTDNDAVDTDNDAVAINNDAVVMDNSADAMNNDASATDHDASTLAAIPDTLQDALNERLDRLGDAKAFAQLAAAFGGTFAYSQVSRVAQQNNIDAAAGMDALHAAGLLIARPCANGDCYAFRHELLREAAYHALLRTTRRHYRRQIRAVKAQAEAEAATSSERPAVALSKHRGAQNNSRARIGPISRPRTRVRRGQ